MLSFKKWLYLQESIKQNSDTEKRINIGKKYRKPEWAARPEILSMKK